MHPRLAAFLDAERRQVWALERTDGTPVYLAEGMADEMRARAREHLRCPYPGCEATISTRGGVRRRDHFFHIRSPEHPTGPESEAHLAAKAMLAQWARARVPNGADVREEESIKDEDGRLSRRPDVMVTGASGRRVAYEIEYKAWSVAGWQAKQEDLDAASVPCLWLVGHTKVSVIREFHGSRDVPVVRLPELACAIGRADPPLLLVNPVTRQIGTLSASPTFERRWRGESEAFLSVDELDDCSFDPRLGMRTPTLGLILAAEELAARQEAERQQREAEHQARLDAAWHASAAYATVMSRHGYIPDFLDDEFQSTVIRTRAVHWHAALWVDLVDERTEQFAWPEITACLRRHGIAWSSDQRLLYAAVERWMSDLSRLGAVRWYRSDKRSRFVPTGVTLTQILDGQAVEERHEQIEREKQANAEREKAALAADLESRRRTRLVIDANGRRRWVPK